MLDWGNVPSWVAAIGGLGTLMVAVVAASVAYRQLGLARRVREDETRPYVVVDFEIAAGPGHPFVELVIRNIGKTLAKDVAIEFKPPLQSTLDDNPQARGLDAKLADAAILSRGIPSMPPGREYRLLFERMPDRYDRGDLPCEYAVTVSLSSGRKVEEPLQFILDLNVFFGYSLIENYGLNHVAKTLRSWAKHDGVNRF